MKNYEKIIMSLRLSESIGCNETSNFFILYPHSTNHTIFQVWPLIAQSNNTFWQTLSNQILERTFNFKRFFALPYFTWRTSDMKDNVEGPPLEKIISPKTCSNWFYLLSCDGDLDWLLFYAGRDRPHHRWLAHQSNLLLHLFQVCTE